MEKASRRRSRGLKVSRKAMIGYVRRAEARFSVSCACPVEPQRLRKSVIV
jgi:hypothetical protein